MKPKKKVVIKPKPKVVIPKKDPPAPKKPEHKVAHKVKKNDDLPPEVRVKDDSLEVRSFKEETEAKKPSGDEDAPPASDANAELTAGVDTADPAVDAQADDIINQIKSASANIKNADSGS